MIRYICVCFLSLAAWASAGLTITPPPSTAGSSSSTLTNGQVQAANIANGAVGVDQVSSAILYVTNSANFTASVPDATNQWFKVATLSASSILNPVYVRVSFQVGLTQLGRIVLEAVRQDQSNADPQMRIVSYATHADIGFGGVGSDTSGGVYVSVTNASGGALSFALQVSAYSPFSPGARPTLVLSSNAVTDVNNTTTNISPGLSAGMF